MTSIKGQFDYLLHNYDNGNKKAERSDPVYGVICESLPSEIKALFPLRRDLICSGSCGVGQKAEFPWVCIFNTNITRSATRGLYIALLFRKDMSGFYLCLNQGITYFELTYKRKKYEFARRVVDYFQNEIGDQYFSKDPITLGGTRGNLGYGYEQTTIISKFYANGSFEEDELVLDIKKMLVIYDELAGVLAEDNYDYNKAIEKILLDYDSSFTYADDAIEEIKQAISKPTDVSVTRRLKEVAPESRHTRKYAKIRNAEAIRKIDYIERSRSDAEIGELGELLALEYETERLINLGYPDLAKQVKRVNIKSDAFGYDIESYDLIGLKMEKIFIEVKTTTNKLDVDFPVSRNEVEVSKDKGDKYCVQNI